MPHPATSDLPSELRDAIARELGDGERLVWAGSPAARPISSDSAGRVALGAVLLAIDVAFAIYVATWPGPVKGRLVIGCFVAGLALVAIALLASPWTFAASPRRTAYLVTDRRAIVLALQARGRLRVETFEPSRLAMMERFERADGSGDVLFEVVTVGSGSSASTERRGFRGVADARGVEAILRRTLLAGRVRELEATP